MSDETNSVDADESEDLLADGVVGCKPCNVDVNISDGVSDGSDGRGGCSGDLPQAKRAKLEYDDRGSLSGDNNAHGEQLQKQQNEVAAQ